MFVNGAARVKLATKERKRKNTSFSMSYFFKELSSSLNLGLVLPIKFHGSCISRQVSCQTLCNISVKRYNMHDKNHLIHAASFDLFLTRTCSRDDRLIDS